MQFRVALALRRTQFVEFTPQYSRNLVTHFSRASPPRAQ
jgi:hypothetical protein